LLSPSEILPLFHRLITRQSNLTMDASKDNMLSISFHRLQGGVRVSQAHSTLCTN